MFAASDRRMLASMSGPDPRADTLNWSDLGVSELPTGTVTLAARRCRRVDSAVGNASPRQMSDAVARLDRTLTDLVASHSGVRPVEQGEGDSFVVAFARATDAVACALELQQAPLAPIRLRIGVHTGEVRLRDEGNYIGPTINRTARLRDLAHGGQTVLVGRHRGIGVRPASGRCLAHRPGLASAARCGASGTGCAALSSRHSQRVSAAAGRRKQLRRNGFPRSSRVLSAAAPR